MGTKVLCGRRCQMVLFVYWKESKECTIMCGTFENRTNEKTFRFLLVDVFVVDVDDDVVVVVVVGVVDDNDDDLGRGR